jgi:hypothetical protein
MVNTSFEILRNNLNLFFDSLSQVKSGIFGKIESVWYSFIEVFHILNSGDNKPFIFEAEKVPLPEGVEAEIKKTAMKALRMNLNMEDLQSSLQEKLEASKAYSGKDIEVMVSDEETGNNKGPIPNNTVVTVTTFASPNVYSETIYRGSGDVVRTKRQARIYEHVDNALNHREVLFRMGANGEPVKYAKRPFQPKYYS